MPMSGKSLPSHKVQEVKPSVECLAEKSLPVVSGLLREVFIVRCIDKAMKELITPERREEHEVTHK